METAMIGKAIFCFFNSIAHCQKNVITHYHVILASATTTAKKTNIQAHFEFNSSGI